MHLQTSLRSKKRLAIVTSYDDACGNASYSEILRTEFSKTVETDIVVLDHFLLGLTGKAAIELGDRHIEHLARIIAEYDYVNIQFEFSLFGVHPWDVLRRFEVLLRSARNLIVTFHRVELPRAKPDFWRIYQLFPDYHRYRHELGMSDIYPRLIRAAVAAGKKKNVRLVVHTRREKKKTLVMAPEAKVECFPLTFISQDERERLLREKNPLAWKQKLGLPDTTKVIGLFGFISTYKDFITPLQALAQLPQDYTICLFGSQHPMSFREEQRLLPYLKELIELIGTPEQKNSLAHRVRFMGHVSDAEMYEAVANCDAVVVPYLEVGQGMSGIASICLDLKANVIFSNNFSFNELKYYCPGGIRTFDMGNFFELAQKIPRLEVDGELDRKLEAYYATYNLKENIRLHLELFGEIPESKTDAPALHVAPSRS